MLNVLDLFAGIGGFSLGLERTGGFRTVAFCEIDKKAQRVLNKHWPDTPIFDDVSALTKDLIDETVGVPVHVITGGFPCQDISLAGKGAGLEGERSGLWFQFHRLIKEIQPRYAIIENVSALRSRGLEVVLGGLAEIGYDAEWHCIPASAVGAPHRRDRVWIVAYPTLLGRGEECSLTGGRSEGDRAQGVVGSGPLPGGVVADAASQSEPKQGHEAETFCDQWNARVELGRGGNRQPVADAASPVANTHQPRLEGWLRGVLQERAGELPAGSGGSRWIGETWLAEPDVGRVAHGVPNRVDRLKQLGNAVVPQIPQLLGEAILDWENARVAA